MDASPLLTLPPEILFLIIKQCDRKTQVSLSMTNDVYRSLTEMLLWEKLDITYNDMDAFDRYNYLTSWETSDISVVWDLLDASDPLLSQRPPNGGIVQALTQRSSTAKPTWPSGIHVKKLTARLMGPENMAELVPQRSINNVMSLLLPRMPNFESCSIEGLFYTSTLREVVRIQNLHTLELRTSERYMCLNVNESVSGSVSDYYQKSQHLGFRNMVVDFTLLGQLQSLRKLVVGRLVKRETTTLARAISLLSRLEHLEVEAPHWSYRWGHLPKPHPEELDFSSDDPSPVPDFLVDLHECPFGQFSLPESLKVFIIRDKHHIFGGREGIDERRFLQIIRPCLKLHTLVVDITCFDSSVACDDAVEALDLPALRKISFPCLNGWPVWSTRFN